MEKNQTHTDDGAAQNLGTRDYTEWTEEQLIGEYQDLAIKAADCVVKTDCEPERQDWYRDLEDLFFEIAHREGDR